MKNIFREFNLLLYANKKNLKEFTSSQFHDLLAAYFLSDLVQACGILIKDLTEL